MARTLSRNTIFAMVGSPGRTQGSTYTFGGRPAPAGNRPTMPADRRAFFGKTLGLREAAVAGGGTHSASVVLGAGRP